MIIIDLIFQIFLWRDLEVFKLKTEMQLKKYNKAKNKKNKKNRDSK